MEFAAAFIPGMPASEVVDLARLAEELGYDCLWMPDQTFYRDPFVLLGLCAQATRRIRLGLAVTNPYTRHPVQIARAAATVGEIAGGRFILGLGAGNRSRVLGSLGMDPSQAARRIEECITVCRSLLRGERVNYESPTLTVKDVALDFTSRCEIPIYVASRGPKVLEMGGRVADGVLMEALFTPGGLEYGLNQIAKGVRAARRDPAHVQRVAWQAAYLTNAADAATHPHIRNWAGRIILGTQDRILKRIGIPAEIAARVREDFAAYGEEGLGRRVPPEAAGKVLMIGSVQDLAAHATVLLRYGVTMMSVLILGGTEDVRKTLERFTEVMSQVRSRRDFQP